MMSGNGHRSIVRRLARVLQGILVLCRPWFLPLTGRTGLPLLWETIYPALLLLPLLTTSPTRPISDVVIGRDDFTIGKRTFESLRLNEDPNLGRRTRTNKGQSHIFSLVLPSYSKSYGHRPQHCTASPTRVAKASNNGTFRRHLLRRSHSCAVHQL